MVVCPTHDILRQTFSLEEVRYLVNHRNQLNLCDSCVAHFENLLHIMLNSKQTPKSTHAHKNNA